MYDLIFELFISTHLVTSSPEPICRGNSRVACTYGSMHLCNHAPVYLCILGIYASLRIYESMYLCLFMHLCICASLHRCLYVSVYLCIHAYLCISLYPIHQIISMSLCISLNFISLYPMHPCISRYLCIYVSNGNVKAILVDCFRCLHGTRRSQVRTRAQLQVVTGRCTVAL